MAIKVGWIDFSEKDRKKAIDVIHLLEDKGTVDELGIGVIRDAFSDMFFPGTSTVQTRAKYFFVIPYIIKECCEDRRNKTVDAVKRMIDAREKEFAVEMKKRGEIDGVIGIDVIPDNWVVRKPYSIYWNGLKRFGIFAKNLSLNEYVKLILQSREEETISNWTEYGEEQQQDDRNAGSEVKNPYWNLPSDYTPKWRDNPQITLTESEASHLKERIGSLNDCLLKTLVSNNISIAGYTKNKEPFRFLYESLKNDERISDKIKQDMLIALRFDSLVYVSIILYNRMISNDKSEEALREWNDFYELRLPEIASLDLDDLFGLTNISDRKTIDFLKNVQRCFVDNKIEEARKEIRKREIDLKDVTRSKIENSINQPIDKWIGGHHLDYRMTVSARLINDIFNPKNV